MTRTGRWLVWGAALSAGLGAVACALFVWWVPSDEQLAARVQTEFEQRTGIGLKLGGLHWEIFPVPRVVLEDIATVQDEPIRVGRLEVRPQWRSLLAREVRLDLVSADGVALPRDAVR